VAACEFGGRLSSRQASAGLLDVPGAATDSLNESTTWRSVALEDEQINVPRDDLEQLRAEVTELRASRARLILAADADCDRIERELHDGVQQHLVALAVKLQLVGPLVDANPAAARALVDEMEQDVQEALDEVARLAERIHSPLLEANGLAAALRSAAVSAGVPASVDVAVGSTFAPEISRTIYLCWLEALEHAGGGTRATVTVREEDRALTFEFVETGVRSTSLDGLHDRVEALGGRLTVETNVERGTRVYGSLPLSR
jgi:signal transduction histidine kinase